MTRLFIMGVCIFVLELRTSILGRVTLPPPVPVEKPSRCPKDIHIGCFPHAANCWDDNRCPGNQKCCPVGCVPTCVDPEPVDCPPVCAMFCPYGNVLDDNGCAICECKPESKIRTNIDSALSRRSSCCFCIRFPCPCACPPDPTPGPALD